MLPEPKSQHQLHYKILSRLCTTLQRSPNASRAQISTPTVLQNSFKVLPYIKEVPKCHESLSLNTNYATKFFQGYRLHYRGPQMLPEPLSQHQPHYKILSRFCPTLERSQNASKACVSTPSAQQKFTQGSALHDKGPKMLPKAFVGLAYQGKDIVFRFIIEYSSLRDFGPQVIIGLFLYEDF